VAVTLSTTAVPPFGVTVIEPVLLTAGTAEESTRTRKLALPVAEKVEADLLWSEEANSSQSVPLVTVAVQASAVVTETVCAGSFCP
jgi:hypothetical protein